MLYRDQGATGLSQPFGNCAQSARSVRLCGDIMASVAELDTVTAVNPAALAGVRFLLSHRIEDLDAVAADIEAGILQTAAHRDQARRRLIDAEQLWAATLSTLPNGSAEEIDSAFRTVAAARADVTATEERSSELGTRLNGIRSEQEVLRSVYRSLDDLIASTTNPTSGSARLRSASRQVFQIIEEERMRIARDMHDGPAQSMSNLVLQAEILERLIARDPQMVVNELADFKNGVRSVLDDTRRLIFDLRPMTLDDLGLVPTLRKFVKEFGERGGVHTDLRVVGEETRLAGALEPTLFRIIQEALNNTRKHAQASVVEVVINFQPMQVSAVIRDNGIGMDVAATEAHLDSTRHLGLISMRERAELEKGRLEIRSQIGKGTEVRVAFDL
jgi:two-component system sensor histidine kinase DegS